MEGLKIYSPSSHTPSSPESPVKKRAKFEYYSCHSPPKLSISNDRNYETHKKSRWDVYPDKIDEIDEENSPEEATPEKLDPVPGKNMTEEISSEKSAQVNVLDIPKHLRMNFGIPDLWCLDSCRFGKAFWYDKKHAAHVKYFIALHSDESHHWNLTTKFKVKEQIGLELPQTFKLTFTEILSKIEDACENASKTSKTSKTPPRIWLDVRDFLVLFDADFDASEKRSSPITLIKSIEKLVTHFSLGSHLYSDKRLSQEKLLKFILAHLKNVEYLCLQSEMLRTSETSTRYDEIKLKSSRDKVNLPKLKTIRLSHFSRQMFSFQFLAELLLRSPNLENFYDMPLHLISEIEGRIKEECRRSKKSTVNFKPIIRSVYTSRNHYARHGTAPEYVKHVARFSRRGSGSSKSKSSSSSNSSSKMALFEWSTRLFFLFGSDNRAKCSRMFSDILKENARTLERLSIEPPLENHRDEIVKIHFPTLEKLTTLQVYLMKKEESIHPIFPRGFDYAKKFPNLTHFEIILDRKFLRVASQMRPHYGEQKSRWTFFHEHFPPHIFKGGFKTVKSLSLINFSPFAIMPRLKELFPNVRVLRLTNCLVEVATALHLCYKNWPKLKQIILEINADTKHGNLDAAFTGVAQKAVDTLAHAIEPTSICALNIVAKNRNKLPISHLKELQIVKIILRSSDMFSQMKDPKPIFTPFSIFFGFNLANNPNLKIQVCFNDRVTTADKTKLLKALESVLPFVELDD